MSRDGVVRRLVVRHAGDLCEDVDPEWVRGYESVGLAAGTSTPDETIEAVERRLNEIGEAGMGEAGEQGEQVREIA